MPIEPTVKTNVYKDKTPQSVACDDKMWGLEVARAGIEPATPGFSVLCSTS